MPPLGLEWLGRVNESVYRPAPETLVRMAAQPIKVDRTELYAACARLSFSSEPCTSWVNNQEMRERPSPAESGTMTFL